VRFVRLPGDAGPRWGRLDGEQVRVLSGAPYAGGVETGEALARSAVRLLAPAEPSKVLCVGLNYSEHRDDEKGSDTVIAAIIARNMKDAPAKKDPILFLKAPSAIIGPGEPIVLPPEARRVDYEAELTVVIGRRLSRAGSREEAAAAIFGYTLANDVSARDLQEVDVQWMRAKSFDSFCPLGPWIETDLDPAAARVRTLLDGAVVQDAPTSDLIHDVPAVIAYISACMTLLPGDVILTGTPAGVGPMTPGQRVTVEIAGIGALTNPVVAAS